MRLMSSTLECVLYRMRSLQIHASHVEHSGESIT
jgi:hypothetical protein